MNEKGIAFRPEGSDSEFHLTPEKSIQLQIASGADIVVCLDDCTHVDDPFETRQIGDSYHCMGMALQGRV